MKSQYSSSDSPFEGEDGNAGLGDRRGRLVLRAEDVAACPAHRSAQLGQGLDQHGRLDRHVQRAGHPDPFQGFLGAVFLADGHQAGHFLLGHGDFLAAPIGEAEVPDLVSRSSRALRHWRTRLSFHWSWSKLA